MTQCWLKKWCSFKKLATLLQIVAFCALCATTAGNNYTCTMYPLWDTFGIHDPTFSGTLLEKSSHCGTEFGQKGSHAVLVYMHCSQWKDQG